MCPIRDRVVTALLFSHRFKLLPTTRLYHQCRFVIRKMNSAFRFRLLFALYACWISLLPTLNAQSPSPSPHGSQTPKYTEEQIQEMAAKLHERIGNATDAVFGRIQKEENDLHIRFSYLTKPDRLNPNTYTSKDDVTQWRQSLQQFKERADSVAKLYENADPDLGNALLQQSINQAIVEQIKKELMQSFPWDVIKKKDQLTQKFVSEFGALLTFYYNNWGSWKTGSSAGAPSFDDPKLASTFQSLKDKVSAVGAQIEDQYRAMTR
jgi:hypothetical protein